MIDHHGKVLWLRAVRAQRKHVARARRFDRHARCEQATHQDEGRWVHAIGFLVLDRQADSLQRGDNHARAIEAKLRIPALMLERRADKAHGSRRDRLAGGRVDQFVAGLICSSVVGRNGRPPKLM